MRNRRVSDPYVDRRLGDDRRKVYDSIYWENEGTERRKARDRRQPKERRASYVKVSKWTSVRVENLIRTYTRYSPLTLEE